MVPSFKVVSRRADVVFGKVTFEFLANIIFSNSDTLLYNKVDLHVAIPVECTFKYALTIAGQSTSSVGNLCPLASRLRPHDQFHDDFALLFESVANPDQTMKMSYILQEVLDIYKHRVQIFIERIKNYCTEVALVFILFFIQ